MQINDSARKWTEAKSRFRFAGQVTAALAVLGWLIWFYPFDDLLDRSRTPLGGDYVMLYVAGQVLADGAANELYDDAKNQQRSSRLFKGLDSKASWPYRYPPTVAAAMVPLSQLPFGWSFALFVLIQLLLLAVTINLLQKNYSVFHNRSAWMWAMIGSPLVLESLIGGQSSLLGLACVVGFLHFLRRDNPVWAGTLLALTLYKPNVAALLIVAALILRPRLLYGFLPTAAVGLIVGVWATGTSGVSQYVQLATQLASAQWSIETPYWKVHGLAPLFQWVVPEHGKLVCGAVGLSISLLIASWWRSGRLHELLAVSLLLCINALFNPYVPIYDLVLLQLALVLVCQAAYQGVLKLRSVDALQCGLGLLFAGPHLSQALARPLGWQLFPLLLSGAILATITYELRLRSNKSLESEDPGKARLNGSA